MGTIVNDEIILNYFYGKNKNLHKSKLENIPEIYKKYLDNRFDYITSYKEAIYRIKLKLEIHPKCPICGKYVKINKIPTNLFQKTCGNKKCNIKLTQINLEKTCKEKYGVKCVFQNKDIKEKIQKTCLYKYGVTNPLKNKEIQNKLKETCLNKYGVTNGGASKEAQEKIKRTCLKKYGVDNVFKVPEIIEKCRNTLYEKTGYRFALQNKDSINKMMLTNLINYGTLQYNMSNEYCRARIEKTNLEKYGNINPFGSKEIIKKLNYKKQHEHAVQTMVKNGCGMSGEENICYDILLSKFDYNDIKRQYKESRYPYHCDFYIKSLDLFIEYQGYWTHNNHIFNPMDLNDINILKIWESKNYQNGIYTWTIKDVEKRNIAKKNNLNYKEIWTINEMHDFVKGL